MPVSVSAVHNGVRSEANGSHAEGKPPNSKQVGLGAFATSSMCIAMSMAQVLKDRLVRLYTYQYM